MFDRFLSALWAVVTWIFDAGKVKWIVGTGVVYMATAFLELVISYIPAHDLSAAFSLIPPDLYYFLNLFEFDFGFGICMSALVSRFIIRRLPVVG